MERWVGSSAVLGECVIAIRGAIEDHNTMSILRPELVGQFVDHVAKNPRAMRDPQIL